MPSEWPSPTFGELMEHGVLEIGDGYRAKNDELGGSGLIFLRAGHVTDTHIDFDGVERFVTLDTKRFGPKIARAGDVVVTTKGNSTGRVAFITGNMPAFVYSPHLSYWRSKSDVVLNQGFLRAWSRASEFSVQLAAMSRSTDMAPYLSLSDQRRLRITLPPIAVQRRIGELGDALDERISLLRKTNSTLESIAQALFKSWFIDFDPVRAKAEGREPEGMDEETAALFPDSFEDSALGDIPKGWRSIPLSQLCTRVSNGSTPSRAKSEFWDGGEMPWYKTGELSDGFLLTPSERITAAAVMNTSVKVLPRYAILMAIYAAPTVGRLGILLEDSTFNQACTGMVAKADVGPWFLFQTLLHGREWFNSRANGAAQQNISKGIVEGYLCVQPNEEVLAAFNQLASAIYTSIKNNAKKAALLGELRDTLLPRLISGKLCLPEAEAQVSEALA
ncbi:restriction endonuclease subunit S [Burkholderia seminalis]|uniref:restriction endonuclease subunit S n=1 Tax=Burkholderia seminalis TaxID=488731 RepID=UPI0015895A00|nr:restriction endonuclease subunit S [Burkholderia seminalis]